MNSKVGIPQVTTGFDSVTQPTLYLNWHLELADGSELGNDVMRLVSFSGQEQLSNPFSFTLELHGDEDKSQSPYAINELVGRIATVGICLRDSKEDVENDPFHPSFFKGAKPKADFEKAIKNGVTVEDFSFFNGMVTGFSMSKPGVYTLTMKPSLWRLMLTNDYRIHQQLSIRTAIEYLMKKHQINFSTEDLVGKDNSADFRVQDWLQAGESDFEFLQRLLSKSNIHFYFKYTPNSHQVVFSNKASYPAVFPDGRRLKYTFTEMESVDQADVIHDYSYSQEIASSSVASGFTRQEAAWESCTVAGQMSFYSDPPQEPGDLPFRVYKIIQYGGSDSWVNGYSGQVADMAASSATSLSGSSQNPEIRVGHKVQLEMGPHPGPKQVNPYLDQKWFVFNEAQHQASLDGSYTCKFKATEADGLITPFDAHGTHQGSLLAEVVAQCHGSMPSGWKYYEKSAFDPETSIDADGSASNSGVIGGIDHVNPPNPKELNATGVFVRFTTAPDADPVFVKLSASMQTCPEIGSMVIVARASDESELPEVQQSVQANGSRVVTPCGWTANTHQGSSYSTSYGDGKSIRFGLKSAADLEGAIKIIEDEYNDDEEWGPFRDSSYSQGASYSYSTSENGRSATLSKSHSLGNTWSDHKGDRSISYSDVNFQESTSLNDEVVSFSTITTSSDSTHVNEGSTTSYSEIKGPTRSTNIQNSVISDSTTNGATTSTNLTKGTVDSTSTFEAKVTDHSTHNADVESHATNKGKITSHSTHNGDSITTSKQTGDSRSSQVVTGDVTSKSKNTGDVSNTSNITGHESNTSKRNSVNNNSKTNTSVSVSMMGATTDTNLVGASNHNSVTGAAGNTSVVGVSVSMNLIGADASMTLAASTNNINITGSAFNMSMIGLATDIRLIGSGISLTLSEQIELNQLLGSFNFKEIESVMEG